MVMFVIVFVLVIVCVNFRIPTHICLVGWQSDWPWSYHFPTCCQSGTRTPPPSPSCSRPCGGRSWCATSWSSPSQTLPAWRRCNTRKPLAEGFLRILRWTLCLCLPWSGLSGSPLWSSHFGRLLEMIKVRFSFSMKVETYLPASPWSFPSGPSSQAYGTHPSP